LRTLVLLCILCGSLRVHAQLQAAFTADKTAGCSPLTVNFSNTSKNASATATYTWNFGNGNALTTADAVDPVAAIYYTPRTYRVTLTVKDKGKTSRIARDIIVYKNPTVQFTMTPAEGCSPLTVVLNSTSDPGSGTISQYFWDFGDGRTLQTAGGTQTEVFSVAGTYTPSLTVTNSRSCSASLSIPGGVVVLPKPEAAFSTTTPNLCHVSDTARFTNTSAGAAGYQWSFGDGAVSTAPNPVHVYAAPGTYTVTLVAANAGGCSDTLVQTNLIHVAQLSPAINIASPACVGAALRFADGGSPAPTGTSQWSFGDGQTGTGTAVTHAYTTPGTYTVSLTDNLGSCPSGTSVSVTVNPTPVLSGFVATPSAVCTAPIQVHFADTSKGGVHWLWNFTGKPGDTSTEQDPVFSFPANQTYTPSLTVTNAFGCSSTVTQTVYPSEASAALQVLQTLLPSATVCAGVSAFCSVQPPGVVSSYQWSFGDGTTATTATPTHVYTTPGTYYIQLSYVTQGGCTGTAGPDTVKVYPSPRAAFTAIDSSACGSNRKEYFKNRSDSAAQYYWIFGDGTSATNNDSTVIHLYPRFGPDTVLLIASSPGCAPDTAEVPIVIMNHPAPKGAVIYSCLGNRDTVVITDSAQGGSLYTWSWGDGSPDETDNTYVPGKTHVYPGQGSYKATITGVFGACTVTGAPIPVYILAPQHPTLTLADSTVCGGGALSFQVSGLDSDHLAQGYYYTLTDWQYPDGRFSAATGLMKTSYSGAAGNLLAGEDSLRLLLTSVGYGCVDTSNYAAVKVTGPMAAFTVAATSACFHGPVVFTDASKGTGGVPLVRWVWNFGDSTTVTRTSGDTVAHVYGAPGTYFPTLTVTDARGCVRTVTLGATDSIVVSAPVAGFTWAPQAIVPGVPVTFYNTSSAIAGTTYQWTFYSDGSRSAAADSLEHTYGAISRDTVRLIAVPPGGAGCPDTVIQVVTVTGVNAAFQDSTVYLGLNGCPPMVAYFTSTVSHAVRIAWNFGDGATAGNNPTPSHTYTLPGLYTVILTAYGAGGDSLSVTYAVLVNGPRANLHSSLLQACSPATDTLTASGAEGSTYTWDFGDGTVLSTADTMVVHRYAGSGIYTTALLVSDASGCQAVFHLPGPLVLDTLYVQPLASLTRCDTGTMAFTPLVTSLMADSLGAALQYTWDFGTGRAGDTAATQNASFDFGTEGAYAVSLLVRSPAGCTAATGDTIKVAAPPALHYKAVTDICIGDSAQLSITGASSYRWNPGSALDITGEGTAVARPGSSTTYSALAYGLFGCYTDTVKMAVDVHPLPTVTIPAPAPVAAGGSVTLEATVSPDVTTQTWSPGTYLNCTVCASPVSMPLQQVTYTDSVETQYGCKAADSVVVALSCAQGSVRIPSGFTPNHDGNNDYFMPIGRGVKVVLHFRVYSRYGDLVYEAENLPIAERQSGIGWDGTKGGRALPPGTYVYFMEFECLAGQTFYEKGTVELIR
jgi:gliding motility-associated-like protein